MKLIIVYFLVISASYLSSTVEAVGQTVNKCVTNCRGDKSCTTRLEASEYAHPGDVRDGSCDQFGRCSPKYTVHCHSCFDFCSRKQETNGVYDTAVITISVSENKELQKNKREKVTCNNLKSTRSKAVDRELISAAKDSNLLNCLLSKRVYIEAATNYGYTLLISSASFGNLQNVKTLLNRGANINAENNQGVSAFILAAEKGHLEVVKELAKKENRLNIEHTDLNGRTALIWAAMNGHLEVVKYLIENKNANVNALDKDGQNSLVLASQNNHNGVVSYLAGVPGSGPVNPQTGKPNFSGNNEALITEAAKGNEKNVMALINNNNKNYQDRNGKTALIAAAEGGHEQLVSYLIKQGVDVRKATKNSQTTALHLEASNGHLQNVKDLLKNGAEVNAEARYDFKEKYTPIILAAKEGHKDVVDHLIRSNANVEQEAEDGYNAILWATQQRHRDVVSSLIDYYKRKSDGLANLFINSFNDIQKLKKC